MKKSEIRKEFYSQLIAILQEPTPGFVSLTVISKRAYEITQEYNAKYEPRKNESEIAAGLTFLASRYIVRKVSRHNGTFWSLLDRADIEGFLYDLG